VLFYWAWPIFSSQIDSFEGLNITQGLNLVVMFNYNYLSRITRYSYRQMALNWTESEFYLHICCEI
jgi:hypothetical protein